MGISNIQEATVNLKGKLNSIPKIGLVLGSGLGTLAEEIENPVIVPYKDIPHFPVSTVSGHEGQFVIGTLEGAEVIAMQGRFHYYEGYSLERVTFPIRVMKELGTDSLIVTNAAGGINQDFEPGDLMLIHDHINNMGVNPLIGENDESLGVRFPDMSEAYDEEYITLAEKCAAEMNLKIKKGIYIANTGPTYETPAEVKMLRCFGADAVGMSTVPEVIVAKHAGMKVLGISCISNMAAGILDQPLSHEEVIETTTQARGNFSRFVKKIIQSMK